MLKIITNKADWTDDAALFSIRILDELSKKRERVFFFLVNIKYFLHKNYYLNI